MYKQLTLLLLVIFAFCFPACASDNSLLGTSTYLPLSLGLICGTILSASCILFALYVTNRQPQPLFHGLFLFSTLLTCLASTRDLALWQKAPEYQASFVFIAAAMTLGFFNLYRYGQLKHYLYDDRPIKLLAGLSVMSFLSIPASLAMPLDYAIGLGLVLLTSTLLTQVGLLYINYKDPIYQLPTFNWETSVICLALVALLINLLTQSAFVFSSSAIIQLMALIYLALVLWHFIGLYQHDLAEQDDKDLQLSEQMLELQFALKELQEKNEQLEKLNTLDELSGIHNRRYFDKRLLAELRRCRRELAPLSLIMFDIDHFKKFNDNHGHVAGDEVIRSVALVSSEQISRESDEIFRYGGEEYAILLPNTELDGALFLAEKVRAAIESLTVHCGDKSLDCTVSLGVACHLSEHPMQPNEFIEQADTALYQAKQNGRNQVAQYNQSR